MAAIIYHSPPTIDALVSAGVSPEQAEAWIQRCERLRGECGCEAGVICFLAILVLGPLGLLVPGAPPLPWWLSVAAWLAAGLVGLAVGKSAGIGLARLRLKRLLVRLHRRAAGPSIAGPGPRGPRHA